MCLYSIDSTGIKPAKEGWKVFKKVCLDGTLLPLYYGYSIKPGKWISTRSFLDKLFCENKNMIFIHSTLCYEAGFHIFHNKEDAIAYPLYTDIIRKVLVKDPICVGYQHKCLVTVARKMKVLSEEESK